METNRIYNENCIETMAKMPDNFIDLTVTSPPYDNLREYKGYSFPFEHIAKELFRVTKEGGVVVWVVGDATINGSETGTSFRQALYFKDMGFRLHDTMIYQKENYVPLSHNRYEQCFDYMFIFSKNKPKTFYPIKVNCKHAGKIEKYGNERRSNFGKTHSMRTYGEATFRQTLNTKNSKNIFTYKVGCDRSGHPAAFPEKLAKDHIISWSNEGDLIYDPFGGSGTTAKMAHLLNRKWILSEISQEYCEIAEKRILPHILQTRLF
jgi:site-specific DNA-methyltransferase (adenine-specific)